MSSQVTRWPSKHSMYGSAFQDPNTTHLKVKTTPGDQDGNNFDLLKSEQFMCWSPHKHLHSL